MSLAVRLEQQFPLLSANSRALLADVTAQLDRLDWTAGNQNVWLGLSGGVDSMVLLDLLYHWRQILPADQQPIIQAIHVHHGLMPEADEWLQQCQRECVSRGIPLIAERVAVIDSGAGLEAAARQARYQAFHKHCQSGYLLLAHHADDQLETSLMHFSRGSGLAGIAGMPRQRELAPGHPVTIYRPLLDCPRQRLLDWANEAHLAWAEDPSNQDTDIERNWWRQSLVPDIEERFPGRTRSMRRSVNQLQQDLQALELLLQPHLQQCLLPVSWPGSLPVALNSEQLLLQPDTLQSHLLRGWLRYCKVLAPSQARLQQWLEQLNQQQPVNSADLVDHQGQAVRLCRYRQQLVLVSESAWQFLQCGTDKLELVLDKNDAGVGWQWSGGWLTAWTVGADGAVNEGTVNQGESNRDQLALLPGRYEVVRPDQRKPVAMDTIRPLGRPAKTLKHLWQEAGIPVWLRAAWPLLYQDGQWVGVVGIAYDASVVAGSSVSGGIRLLWQSCKKK